MVFVRILQIFILRVKVRVSSHEMGICPDIPPEPIDLFTDSDAIFEKSIPQCIMGYPGYMCIRREVNKL